MLDENPPTWMVGTATGIPMGWNFVKGLSIPTRGNGGWEAIRDRLAGQVVNLPSHKHQMPYGWA